MHKNRFDSKLSRPSLDFKPLYKQVEEHVTQLIVERRWKPGEMLPNEFELADELKVSQGTVRKALNSLTRSQILTRRQGIGTFVSEQTGQHSLYRFFPLIGDGKSPELPTAELLAMRTEVADKQVREALELSSKAKVIVLERKRILNGEFCIVESIFLPYQYFKALEKQAEVPHTLYHFYQTQFNLTVRETQDSIKAVLAEKADADILGIIQGEPLLEIKRTTTSLDNKLMEYRISRCRSDHYHYLVQLG